MLVHAFCSKCCTYNAIEFLSGCNECWCTRFAVIVACIMQSIFCRDAMNVGAHVSEGSTLHSFDA
jgi:hypothetical protein